MENRRVVITGIGLVSPLGSGMENFRQSIEKRVLGIRPSNRIKTDTTKSKYSAEIIDFQADKLISPKTARRINRFSLIAMGAIKLAFADAKIEVPYDKPEEIGMILSTDYGPSQTVSDYYKDFFLNGPCEVSPTLFSQTVMNVAVGYIAIEYRLKGISTLVQGCDGLFFANEHIKKGENPVIVVGGVEELVQTTFESYDTYGYLATDLESSLPMDKNSEGTFLGEGACFFVLEDYEHAKSCNREEYGEIAGIGISADTMNDHFLSEKSDMGIGLQLAMERAIQNAKIDPCQIEGIYSCSNGSEKIDAAEHHALQCVFGNDLENKWVVCGKSYYGECFQGSNFFNMTLALMAIKEGIIYPNRKATNTFEGLNLLKEKREHRPNYVLCNNIYSNGTNVSVIFKNTEI